DCPRGLPHGITASVARRLLTAHRSSDTRDEGARISYRGVISRESSYDSPRCLYRPPASAQCPATTLARVCDGRRRVGTVHDLGVCVRGTLPISNVTRPPGFSGSHPTPRLVRHCHGRDRHRHHLLPSGSTLGCTL